jgi:DNA-binding GntR family transcriptional regulator
MPPGEAIEADLRRRLASGEWDHGQQLPAVSVLADHYGVARRTVSRVMARLAADGLVVVRASWGTHRA